MWTLFGQLAPSSLTVASTSVSCLPRPLLSEAATSLTVLVSRPARPPCLLLQIPFAAFKPANQVGSRECGVESGYVNRAETAPPPSAKLRVAQPCNVRLGRALCPAPQEPAEVGLLGAPPLPHPGVPRAWEPQQQCGGPWPKHHVGARGRAGSAPSGPLAERSTIRVWGDCRRGLRGRGAAQGAY